jgi:ABC-type glycerol-3-phosphate transport system substrate-binding protein
MNIRPFEIGLIGIFALVGILGLFFMANYEADKSKEAQLYGDRVAIWGTFSRDVVELFLLDLQQENDALKVITYRQVDPRSFESELLNAIAEGESPDLVIMPHTLLVTYRSKLQAISSETIDPKKFRDTYVDGAEIFLMSDGTYGIPFAVDPLVMYWNRDIFSSSGLASPPKTWETLVSETTGAIVRTDGNMNPVQSAVAFGEYRNVANAKEVLSMLLMQAGSTIVNESNRGYTVMLGENTGSSLSPGEAVLTFYTQFVVPGKELYSWSRSKPLDRSEFLAGKLALYFGKGSEWGAIARGNANLNFDIAPVPQGEGAVVKRSYGDFYAFSIPRASKNMQGAYAAAQFLASPANAQVLTDALDLAPALRSLHGLPPNESYKQVVNQSALIARGWLDPSPGETNSIFESMVEEYTSGRVRLHAVISDATSKLEALFN